MTSLDESPRTSDVDGLWTSGLREAICPPTTGTFYSIGSVPLYGAEFAAVGGGDGAWESGTYTFTIELPIHGAPQLYPFDTTTGCC